MIVGEYWNLIYSGSAKNNYHYVTITYDSFNSLYFWENRANSKWKLHPTEKEFGLRVDESVDYYSSGWTIARVTEKSIFGTYHEF